MGLLLAQPFAYEPWWQWRCHEWRCGVAADDAIPMRQHLQQVQDCSGFGLSPERGTVLVKGSCRPLFPPFTCPAGYRRCSCDSGNSHQFTASKKVSRWPCCHFNKAPGQRVAYVCSQDSCKCSIMMYYKPKFQCNWRNKPRQVFALENKSICLHEGVWDCDSCDLNSLFFSGLRMNTKKGTATHL